MAWTTDMIDNLKKLWKKGLTTNEIAKELGVSKNSIVGKVHRLNLTSRPSPIKKKDDETEVEVQSQETLTDVAPENVQKKAVKADTQKHKEPEKPQAEKQEKTAPASVSPKRGIKLSELDSHTCRWPLGDPKDDGFCFCGAKVRTGQTYCDEHAAIAYVKPNKK